MSFPESLLPNYHAILGGCCQELVFWAIFFRDGGINDSVSFVMTGFGGKLYCLLNDAYCLTKRSAKIWTNVSKGNAGDYYSHKA